MNSKHKHKQRLVTHIDDDTVTICKIVHIPLYETKDVTLAEKFINTYFNKEGKNANITIR